MDGAAFFDAWRAVGNPHGGELSAGKVALCGAVIRLALSGHLILNSDDRLPLVVAFRTDSPLSLDDVPGNALRALLQQHLGKAAQELARPQADGMMEIAEAAVPDATGSGDEWTGPLLETSWDQCNPCNLLAPADSSGNSYLGCRAPTGCVAKAHAMMAPATIDWRSRFFCHRLAP